MERHDLGIGIPVPTTTTTEATPPEADASNRRASRTSYSSGAPPFPFQLKSPIINANETCPYLEILNLIQSSKILGVVNIFMYALEEVAGDPAMHVLLLKLGEKQKGDFFKETLELPQMQEFLPLVQRSVLSEQWVQQLNHILHEVTGLTLQNFELFAYVVKVIQYLVWGHPFAAA
ncbi:unnamed protein product [Orchesella dallaii]|uniref:Uncharacterized protein n=1 Tax=Orchesella dallaii TaxID=48710 RepID=A0ABP1QR07_9HEXA